jgi:hypothetical protein
MLIIKNVYTSNFIIIAIRVFTELYFFNIVHILWLVEMEGLKTTNVFFLIGTIMQIQREKSKLYNIQVKKNL